MENNVRRRQFATMEMTMTGGSELEQHLAELSPEVRKYLDYNAKGMDHKLELPERRRNKIHAAETFESLLPFEQAQLSQYGTWMQEQISRVSHSRRR